MVASMRVDVRNPFGRYLAIIDLETGLELKGVLWADDTKGEYAQYPQRSTPQISGSRMRPQVKRGRIEIRFDGPEIQRRIFERYMDPERTNNTSWPPKQETPNE